MTKTTAIIPARGGSKGVPRKNVLPLAGKPLIGWTIEAAKNAATVERVVVSTDDPEIRQVSERFGAEVIWRPAEISGDLASSEEALLHAVEVMDAGARPASDIIVFLQCTAPLMMAEDIDGTVQAMVCKGFETALAVADFHYFIWKEAADGDFVGINHEKHIRQLRQQREANFIEAGSVYAMSKSGLLTHRHRFFGRTACYVMPPERVLEIDEPVDYRVAEVLLRDREREQQRNVLPDPLDLIVIDFDGVLTDDRVLVSQDGSEAVWCSRADGMGVKLAREAGIRMLVLSSETNPVVARRAEKLQLEVVQGTHRKAEVLSEYLAERGMDWANIIYIGNDVNDVDCLRRSGCGVAVADADSAALSSADIVLSQNGGSNAVRELLDLVLTVHRMDT